MIVAVENCNATPHIPLTQRKNSCKGLDPERKRQWAQKKFLASWKSPKPHHFSNDLTGFCFKNNQSITNYRTCQWWQLLQTAKHAWTQSWWASATSCSATFWQLSLFGASLWQLLLFGETFDFWGTWLNFWATHGNYEVLLHRVSLVMYPYMKISVL